MRACRGSRRADVADQLALRHVCAHSDALGVAAQVEVSGLQISGVFDLQRVATAAAPALEGHDTVGHGVYGRPFRGGVIDARVGAVDLVDRVFAGVGEARADPRVLERGLEQLLAQAGSVGLPVLDLAALTERYGVILLVALRELGAPDAADAHRYRVVDEALVVDHREAVALLDAEEIDRPLVDVLHLGGQGIGQVLLHDGSPERGVDHGALLHAAQRAGLLVLADRHRIIGKAEDDIVGVRGFVGQVVEVGRIERVLVDEDRVLVACADVPQGEDVGRGLVETVHQNGRNAISVEDLAECLARGHLARFCAVVVRIDAVEQVPGLGLLPVFGCGLLAAGPVAGARCEEQGAYGCQSYRFHHSAQK